MDSRKNAMGHVTSNLHFCIRVESAGRVVDCGHPGREMVTHYFSCSGGTSTDSITNASRHTTLNL
jgi:hypothetical protein